MIKKIYREKQRKKKSWALTMNGDDLSQTDLLCFDSANDTPDNLGGIAVLFGLFLFTRSDGKVYYHKRNSSTADRSIHSAIESLSPIVKHRENNVPGGTSGLIYFKDVGRASSC